MSNFPAWFKKAYKRWSQSQAGEEDFIAFCDLLGYPPAKVLAWFDGEQIPQGPEVLSIAGTLGVEAYSVLGLPEVDPELLKIFADFSHLRGEFRSRLAQALWEAQIEIQQSGAHPTATEAQRILEKAMQKWGL